MQLDDSNSCHCSACHRFSTFINSSKICFSSVTVFYKNGKKEVAPQWCRNPHHTQWQCVRVSDSGLRIRIGKHRFINSKSLKSWGKLRGHEERKSMIGKPQFEEQAERQGRQSKSARTVRSGWRCSSGSRQREEVENHSGSITTWKYEEIRGMLECRTQGTRQSGGEHEEAMGCIYTRGRGDN